jgi:hypothetical protein
MVCKVVISEVNVKRISDYTNIWHQRDDVNYLRQYMSFFRYVPQYSLNSLHSFISRQHVNHLLPSYIKVCCSE